MNEKEVANLYHSLSQCRDSFMKGRTQGNSRQPVKRSSDRDRELRECMRNR